MNPLAYAAFQVLETLLRVLPIPCRTGLIRIGNPGRDAPVLLTGNFHLSVLRVRRALAGRSAYLLVAGSRGINVWCAAAGGHFTHHDVVSALKLSGIEDLVDHRRVILPQLAACGIEAAAVRLKTGWRVVWGPVDARDIPAFLDRKLTKTARMRSVRFPWPRRLEMAVAWAFPISLVFSLLLLAFWPDGIPLLVLMAWGLSLAIFLGFPLYARRLRLGGKRVGFVFFDFGRGGLQLILWAGAAAGFLAYTWAAGGFSWTAFLRWGAVSLVVILVISIDLAGSTPVLKSGLHEERLWDVVLDPKKCRQAGFCSEVCPRDCFAVDKERRETTMPSAGRCIRCGACVLQCPFDALSFRDPEGKRIGPETIRKYRLNLMGKRSLHLQGSGRGEEEQAGGMGRGSISPPCGKEDSGGKRKEH